MKRPLMLTALLITTLSIAACGASEPQQSEQAAPPQETQAAPAADNAATETAPTEAVPEESARGDEGGEAAGSSVTTLQGEQVSLGGQGDVTALFFMAGW